MAAVQYADASAVDLSFTVDPRFTLDEERHIYHFGDQRLASVSSIVKELKVPFEKNRISKFVARKRGVTQKQVLAEWDEKRDRATRRGAAVHWSVEHYLRHGTFPAFLPTHVQLDDDDRWDVWRRLQVFRPWYESNLRGMRVVATEVKMYSLTLGIAGTADTVALHNSYVYVGDWKTNGTFRCGAAGERIHEHLTGPLSHLPDTELNSYSVQVSLYRVMLREHGIHTAGGFIVHIPEQGPPVLHRALDLRRVLWDYLMAA